MNPLLSWVDRANKYRSGESDLPDEQAQALGPADLEGVLGGTVGIPRDQNQVFLQEKKRSQIRARELGFFLPDWQGLRLLW